MQFHEVSDFGLRVITLEYVKKDNPDQIVRLIPMVHIGEDSYYQQVKKYIQASDKIIFEGMQFKTGELSLKNRRRLANKLELELQPNFTNENIDDKFIHADYDEYSGHTAWNNLTSLDKLIHNYVFPIWILFQDINLTRAKYVKYFMRSNADIEITYGPAFDKQERIKDFIHKNRNAIVFQKITELLEALGDNKFHIAIVYGAGHMNAIFRYLTTQHNYIYKYKSAEFIEVFKT